MKPLWKRLAAALTVFTLLLAPAACGADPGEDRIRDGEINVPGD